MDVPRPQPPSAVERLDHAAHAAKVRRLESAHRFCAKCGHRMVLRRQPNGRYDRTTGAFTATQTDYAWVCETVETAAESVWLLDETAHDYQHWRGEP